MKDFYLSCLSNAMHTNIKKIGYWFQPNISLVKDTISLNCCTGAVKFMYRLTVYEKWCMETIPFSVIKIEKLQTWAYFVSVQS